MVTSYDAAVDCWALGCIIFEMLTGEPPFTAADESVLFYKITDNHIDFPKSERDGIRAGSDRSGIGTARDGIRAGWDPRGLGSALAWTRAVATTHASGTGSERVVLRAGLSSPDAANRNEPLLKILSTTYL